VEVYRWDLDKTYLATDFESVRGLWRAARESPEEKRNVPGSAELLRALSRRPGARVVILSGSPTQMRDVLAEKLRLDGVRFDELHLKDSLRHLKRGRFRAIKGQFGYKLPALLQGRIGLGAAARETLFGDDAEVDAIVYSVFADAVSGRLTPVEVSRIMEAAGAYPDRIQTALDALDKLSESDAVERIFIRLEKAVPPGLFEPLGSRVVPVYSWFQASLVLYGAGRIDAPTVAMVAEAVNTEGGLGRNELGNQFQDIVRRGHVELDAMRPLFTQIEDHERAKGVLRACQRRLGWMGSQTGFREPQAPSRVDYLQLLEDFHSARRQ
jgi:hypothetical protein